MSGSCSIDGQWAPSIIRQAGAPILTTLGYTLIDLASVLLILSILSIDNPLARVLNLAPLRYLGRISYGFYVFHDMFHAEIIFGIRRLVGWEDFRHDRLVYGVLGFLLTVVLATLSYRFYETPFLRLKSRFAPAD